MRNIQNNSLIRFFYGDLENIISEPFPDPVLVRPGDIIRTLANKYEIGSEDYKNLSICVLPTETPFITPIIDRIPVVNSIGSIRVQAIEEFTHFRIRVDGFLANNYRQFTLSVEGVQEIMIPFSYSGPSFSEMMDNLADYFQSIPQTVVRTKVNGPIMDVWMMKTNSFVLAGPLSVQLGDVTALNQNTPVLASVFLNSYVKGANKDYQMGIIGTIVEGNQFNFNGLVYTASKGTVAQDVIDFFTDGEIVNILDASPFILSFTPGNVTKQNSNIPLLYANLSSSGGGFDNWLIKLSGTYQVGNVLTVYTSGRSITHIVAGGDTNASIEAILNPDAGFFTVTSGTQVNVRPTPGQRTTTNDNVVQIFLDPVAVYPSQTIDRYGVTVGSDVRKGNEFKIIDVPNDTEIIVIATSSDSNFTIAEKLSGQTNPYFVFERVNNVVPPNFQALPGYAYTEEDLTPVTVVAQPTMIKPDQVIVEMTIPTYNVLPRGYYILAIRNGSGNITAISSALDVNDHPYSSLIEAADRNTVFDFNYSEGGLSQRFRAEIGVKIETPTVTETVGQTIEGEDRSINVKIDYNSPFSSGIMGVSLAKSLVSVFKHSFLRIDGRVFRAEAPTYQVLSEYSRQVQMTGTLKYVEEFVDNYDRMIYPRVFAGSNAIISAEYTHGLRLFVRNSTFTKEVYGETSIPANGYYLETISEMPSKGLIRLLIRDQQDVLVEMEIDKSMKHRSIPFRVQPNARVVIELIEVGEINNEGFYPIEAVDIPVIWVPSIGHETDGSSFDDGFDEGFD